MVNSCKPWWWISVPPLPEASEQYGPHRGMLPADAAALRGKHAMASEWYRREHTQEIPAMRTDTGTFPPGSQWTRVPIPACGTTGGGSQYPGSGTDQCDHMGIGTQFAPPIDGAYGFNGMNWNIIDNVQVPNLPTGDYVIGFRFDCEQTTQVWQVCGDVRIVSTPTPPPSDNCDNPLCSSCCVGDCSGCKNCLTDKLSDGCVPCWAAGTQCLSDDDSACEACWSSKPLPASFRTVTI